LSTLDEMAKLEREIESAKREKERATGTKTTLLSQLDSTFAVKSLEGARRKLTKLESDRDETKNTLDKKYAELTDNYAW